MVCCRRARETILTRDGAPAGGLTEEAQAQKAEAEEEKRKKDSHFLAAESIKRELAESASPFPYALNLPASS